MLPNRIYMSEQGLQRARADFERKKNELHEICQERELAHSLSGDGWHDNPYFNRLQQQEAEKTRDVAKQQALLERTHLLQINPAQRPMDVVSVGSVVLISVSYEQGEEVLQQCWEIGGYNESCLDECRLAYNSPLASALLGYEIGEEIEVKLPNGEAYIEILDLLSDLQLNGAHPTLIG